MKVELCPCGTGLLYADCCAPYHIKKSIAPSAEALMRSRYAAFVMQEAGYLFDTTHPSKRKGNSKNAYLSSAKHTKWVKLDILFSAIDVVEFKAYYLNSKFQTEVLHERSNFKLEDGKWYYVDGSFY